MNNSDIKTIKDKIRITGILTIVTGLHIGASSEFAPIGAVDSVVVRDPLTRKPIIPGSSLKGKMRTLLARTETDNPVLQDTTKDSLHICRLFGSNEFRFSDKEKRQIPARLQFCDLFVKDESIAKFKDKTDLYLTEIKFENTISRITSVANPRQIERVPAGMEFGLNLIYNLENEDDLENDFQNIARAFKLLQADYLGGHGTRGYGRISISNIKATSLKILKGVEGVKPVDTSAIEAILKEAENFGLLSV
jgi:CRISPR-associated protein Csm3